MPVSPGETSGVTTVTANAGTGTFTVKTDPGYELGSIKGINSSINVYLGGTAGTIRVGDIPGTLAVYFDQSAPTVKAVPSTGTFTVAFDPGHELGSIRGNTNTLTVFLPDTGHTLGKVDAGVGTFNVQLDPGHLIGGVNNQQWMGSTAPSVGSKTSANSIPVVVASDQATITVILDPGHLIGSVNNAQWIGSTAPSVGSKTSINSIPVVVASDQGTIAVSLDPGHLLGGVNVSQFGGNAVSAPTGGIPVVNTASTMNIFTASGSTSGVSASGITIISPSAAYNFKIYAYSLKTTGISSLVGKFTNGAGTSPTEFWRPLVTVGAPTGENTSVPPPAYLFSTGVNTTLSLLLDTGSLVHYSVSYIKESA